MRFVSVDLLFEKQLYILSRQLSQSHSRSLRKRLVAKLLAKTANEIAICSSVTKK